MNRSEKETDSLNLLTTFRLNMKSLIQLQTEDNNLGTLVVVVHYKTIRYIYAKNRRTYFRQAWSRSKHLILESLNFRGKILVESNILPKIAQWNFPCCKLQQGYGGG